MSKTRPLVLLIDSNALIHRAYHALPATMSTAHGELTNAIYGFVTALLHALETIEPNAVICCFDVAGETFRHAEYDQYKAHRKAMDDALAAQIPRIYEVVKAFNIPIVSKEGFEADDIIGTLSKRFQKDTDVIILTGDKDELQLISPHTSVMMMKQGVKESKVYTEAMLEEEYGLTPAEFITFKALRGDPSDNIPGVSGVGEISALKLVQEYGTLDRLYKALEVDPSKHPLLKGKLRERLETDKDNAYLSYKLSTIDRDVVLADQLKVTNQITIDHEAVNTLFDELEFRSFEPRLKKLFGGSEISSKHSASNVKIVEPKELVNALAAVVSKPAALALSVPTGGLRAVMPSSIALCHERGKSMVAPWDETLVKPLQALCSRKSGDLYVFDAKTLMHILNIHELPSGSDAMILAELLQDADESIALFRHKKDLSEDDLIECGSRSCRLFEQTPKLQSAVREAGMQSVWEKIEQPLTPVLSAIEDNGVVLDQAFLSKLAKTTDDALDALQKQIWHEAGQEFNIASPQQLSMILFEKLGLSGDGIKKKSKGLSTDASTLESLKGAHPIIDAILQYRELSKLKGTYIDALPKLVDTSTGRLHTTYNQIGAATGRISSNDPNLQNIPIRTDAGRQIRKSFIAGKGMKLLSLDYSQFELRILAHLSGDEAMQKSFQEGIDIHTATAASIHGVALDQVTSEMRRAAKTVNFALLYGQSAHTLSKQLGLDYKTGQEFIDRYFASYPRVKAFLQRVIDQSRKDGYYRTLLGRRRLFPELTSAVWAVRQAGERMAMNFPMQGSQADILKLAMINVGQEYENNSSVHFLLTVHDELVFEVKDDSVDETAARIREMMINAYKLAVPIEVSARVGANWDEMRAL